MVVVGKRRNRFWEIARRVLEEKLDLDTLDENVRNRILRLQESAENVGARLERGERPPKNWRDAVRIIKYAGFSPRVTELPSISTPDLVKAALILGIPPSKVEELVRKRRALTESLKGMGLGEKELFRILSQLRSGKVDLRGLRLLLRVDLDLLPANVRDNVREINRILDSMEEKGILEALGMSREDFMEDLGNAKNSLMVAAVLAYLGEIRGNRDVRDVAGGLPSVLRELAEKALDLDYKRVEEEVRRLRERRGPASTKELVRRGLSHREATLIDYSLRVLDGAPLPASARPMVLARVSAITGVPLREISKLRDMSIGNNLRAQNEIREQIQKLKQWMERLPDSDPLKTFLQDYFSGKPLQWKYLLEALNKEGITPPLRPDEAIYELLERKGFEKPLLLPFDSHQKDHYRRRIQESAERKNKKSGVK